MEAKARLLGHAVHPMLIVFPLGLLATAVVFDVIYLFNDNAELATFSYWAIAAGVLGGLAAGLAGLIDWLAIPSGTRAKAIGAWHGGGNLIVTLAFAAAWALRAGETDYAPTGLPLVLELGGAGLAMFTAWLGGELVERLGVGVDRGANLDAPSSLSGEPAGGDGSRR